MSASCQFCRSATVRVERTFYQRLIYAAVYQCRRCRRKSGELHFAPLFSLHSICPRCGSERPERVRRRDPIESLYKSPLSLVQRLFGAPLYYCFYCRLQFYDFRKKRPDAGGRRPA